MGVEIIIMTVVIVIIVLAVMMEIWIVMLIMANMEIMLIMVFFDKSRESTFWLSLILVCRSIECFYFGTCDVRTFAALFGWTRFWRSSAGAACS